MDKLDRYRQLIKKILTEYCQWAASAPPDGVKNIIVFDENQENYLLLTSGWHEKKRILNIMVYLRIQEDKIWVEQDLTKQGIVNDLLEAGVFKEDIVLGFQHPTKRTLAELAPLF